MTEVGPDRSRQSPRTYRRRQRRDHRFGQGSSRGLLVAGASSTILLVASTAAMVGGGIALGGMRDVEAVDERDAQQAILVLRSPATPVRAPRAPQLPV
jgi:hypothetical protein